MEFLRLRFNRHRVMCRGAGKYRMSVNGYKWSYFLSIDFEHGVIGASHRAGGAVKKHEHDATRRSISDEEICRSRAQCRILPRAYRA